MDRAPRKGQTAPHVSKDAAVNTLFVTHPIALRHEMGEGHPEQPDRLRAIERILEGEAFQALAQERLETASNALVEGGLQPRQQRGVGLGTAGLELQAQVVPVAVEVPTTPLPASVTLPAFAASALVTTGTSFVPLIVMVTSLVTVALELSVAGMG